MMKNSVDASVLAVAADLIIRDYLCVKSGEQVLITADAATDPRGVWALFEAARVQKAIPSVVTIPQLPYQGSLSDPYIPEVAVAAGMSCDVWIDMTFPYMSGSKAHSEAMKKNRTRSLNLLDLGAGGISRLFAEVNFDRLFELQGALDELIGGAVGKECHITDTSGTDVRFTIGKMATKKLRHMTQPGTFTPPGSAVIYPEVDSVKGVVVTHAAFHKYFTLLKTPMRFKVDGQIREVTGGGSDLRLMEESLRRAAGGQFGKIIHFSHGFHPAAQFDGRSFNENIRVPGNNAIGFGIPWWQPGGGENHPDGVVTNHSISIDGRQIVRDGALVDPPELVKLEQALRAA